MKFYVYILRSEKNNAFYVGQTKDLAKRLEYHNSSKARWTKRFQPWVLEHFEEYETRTESSIREMNLKSLKGIGGKLEDIKAHKI
ncbi:MAG: GIY-YIG nuclease family protein [Bacteroidetes bacterium]|nr:GIY-YIG nuclease family protein [Bacteroidota bacterium]